MGPQHVSLLHGWQLALRNMTRGERVLLTLAPEYAYGAARQQANGLNGMRAAKPRVPPEATLEFDLELVDFERPGAKDEL